MAYLTHFMRNRNGWVNEGPLYVHTYVCMCMYVCMYVYVCVCVHTYCMCVHMYACISTVGVMCCMYSVPLESQLMCWPRSKVGTSETI